MLFQRLHLQLTVLCALITIAILSIFTALYLSVAEHTMKENLELSFQNRCDTLSSSLKQQSVLTYQYLLRMEQNNDCLIFLWDNGSPLSFNALEHHAAYGQFAGELYENYRAQALDDHSTEDAASADILYIQDRSARSGLYAGISNLSTDGMSVSEKMTTLKKDQGLVLLVLSPNANLHDRIIRQRLTFILLSLAGCLLLTLFSYGFTGKMIKPIRENHERQLAFVAGASHELRTPLAVILSSVEARPPLFEETVKEEALRMGRLVDELLTLSRLDRQSAEKLSLFQFEELEPDTFLLNFYEQTEKYVHEKCRLLKLSLPKEPLPKITADEGKLRQLLEILLENAVSYTEEKGQIGLAVYLGPKSTVCFEVSDNGMGIPDGEKEKIFERFYRIESAHSAKEHFGLGLCIAKEIAEAHKGRITVSDTPGGGCTFRCFLPAAN